MDKNGLSLFDSNVIKKIKEYQYTYAIYSKFRSLKTELVFSLKKENELHYINLDLLYVNDFGKSLYLSTKKEVSNKIIDYTDLELFEKAINELEQNKKILVIDSFQYIKNVFVFETDYIEKFKNIIESNQIQMILISNNIDVLVDILDDDKIIVLNKPEYKKAKQFLCNEFLSINYNISHENIDYILDLTQSIPYYMQEFSNIIIKNKMYNLDNGNEIDENDITIAYDTIYETERNNIMFMLQKANQRKLALEILMYLSVNKNPYDLLDLYDVKKPYINGVIKYLIDNDILYSDTSEKRVENRYKFVNPIMKKNIATRVDKNDLITKNEQKKNLKIN